MKSFISDKYRKVRGGWSRILKISCNTCNSFLFHYQKDGSGPLRRSYVDRINGKSYLLIQKEWIYCPQCKVCLGFNEPYAKENNRPAIRWAVEAVDYKIMSVTNLKVN